MHTFQTSRFFPAAATLVFAAFADPERLARWWGPAGFRNSFEVFECQAGGRWRFTMHGPDGTDYPNESLIEVLEPARRVVIRHLSQPHFRLCITLQPQDAGTLVQWQQVFDDAAIAEAVRHIVEPANEQNLDRWLAEIRRAA